MYGVFRLHGLSCVLLLTLLGCPSSDCAHDKSTCPGVDSGETADPASFTGWPQREVELGDADYIFQGEAPTDAAGAHVAPAGDVDGDGRMDLLVSAYWNDEAGVNAGKIYVVAAQSLGNERVVALADADFSLLGESGVQTDDVCGEGPGGSVDAPGVCGGDWAGHSVAPAGDMDGDGLGDILISGYGNDDAGTQRGRLYLFLGSDLTQAPVHTLGDAAWIFAGEEDGDRLGHNVASAGDIDGDGQPDVISGSYGSDAGGFDSGKAYVWLGSSLGAHGSRLLGSDADFAFVGEEPLDQAGYVVSGLGDVDGDGLEDFAVAALDSEEGGSGRGPSGERGSGKIYVQLAAELPAPGTVQDCSEVERAWVGESGGDAAGYGTAAAGDVDGDGRDDLFVGAYGNDDGGTDSGKAYVVLASSAMNSGTRSLSEADYQFVGSAHELVGQSNSSAGDLDGDGRSDLLISGRYDYFLWSLAGGAHLVLTSQLDAPGTISLESSDFHFLGEDGLDQAGYSVAGVGDVDGDGLGDLWIGAWQADRPDQAGKAYLLLTP